MSDDSWSLQVAWRYEEYHRTRNRYGFACMEEVRGRMLAGWIGRHKRVLDLGCRDGTLTKWYADGNEVVGVDVDRCAAQLAREAFRIEVLCLDLDHEDLPFVARHSFDVVVAAELLEHVMYPHRVVQIAARMLRPGGVFVGSIPNDMHWRTRFWFVLGQDRMDRMHLHRYDDESLVRLLLSAFRCCITVPIGTIGGRRLPRVPGPMAQFLVSRWPRVFAMHWMFKAGIGKQGGEDGQDI